MTAELKKYAAVVICITAAFLSSCAPSRQYLIEQGRGVTAKESSYVKILVLKSSSPVHLSSSGNLRVTDLSKGTIAHESGMKRIVFSKEMVKEPLRVDTTDGSIEIAGAQFRGMAEIHNVMGTLNVINVVKIEDYLLSVVPSEISPSWPIDAIKAQAVAARTYAYYHILKNRNNLYDLDATTASQMYKGKQAETEPTTKGVRETEGEIMTYLNQPIVAFFHSTCGGRTSDNDAVWKGEKIPYLSGRVCSYCSESPYYRWDEEMSMSTMRSIIASKYPAVRKIQGIQFARSQGRVVDATIRHSSGMIRLTGNEFRLIFPEKRIKSMYFEASKKGRSLHFTGRGWGHGVGMCQYGARGMAMKGIGYRNILSYYYKDVRIEKIPR